MAWYSNALKDVFEAHGDDAETALSAFANTAPAEWSEFVDRAAEKEYLRCYKNWVGSHLKRAEKERLTADSGQARLFEPPEPALTVVFRERLFLDGREYDLASLKGYDGADVLARVADRDESPAVTTVQRCRNMRGLAEHMRAETERLGRDVSAGEVLGWAA